MTYLLPTEGRGQLFRYFLSSSWRYETVAAALNQTTSALRKSENIQEQKDVVVMGEPLMLNPNSYANVETVMREVRSSATNDKHWVTIGCDGNPYMMAQHLRDRDDDLKDMLVLPGPGHLEMNMVRAIVKILWPLGLKELAGELCGAKSAESILNCKDHHKSWNMIVIYHNKCISELVEPYLHYCRGRNIKPTTGGYYEWSNRATNAMYIIIKDINMTYVMALMLYRYGIRFCKSDVAMAGRLSFAPLFYETNMTTYMDVRFSDVVTRLKAPTKVLNLITSNE